jgi:DNA-directed RNA polymerase subunit RPC12/RpoP
MADFVTLTCPTCGGKLQITPDIDRFACTHCGNEHLVKRGQGVIAIQPLAESLIGLKRATDRTASELAIRRLTDELQQLQASRQQVEIRIASHRGILAAHDERKVGCQSVIVGLVATPVCTVAYMASDQMAKGRPEGSLVAGVSWVLLVFAGLFVLMTLWFMFKWLLSSDPTPERKIVEEHLRAAKAELASLAELIARKQEEIEQHKRMVALGD